MLESKRMKKDSQFTFRIPSDLKVRLEEIALSEGRSVAQICVALLQEGIEMYKRKAPVFCSVYFRDKRRIREISRSHRFWPSRGFILNAISTIALVKMSVETGCDPGRFSWAITVDQRYLSIVEHGHNEVGAEVLLAIS